VTVWSMSHLVVWQQGKQGNTSATCEGAALLLPLHSVIPFLCGEYLSWEHGDGILCVP